MARHRHTTKGNRQSATITLSQKGRPAQTRPGPYRSRGAPWLPGQDRFDHLARTSTEVAAGHGGLPGSGAGSRIGLRCPGLGSARGRTDRDGDGRFSRAWRGDLEGDAGRPGDDDAAGEAGEARPCTAPKLIVWRLIWSFMRAATLPGSTH